MKDRALYVVEKTREVPQKSNMLRDAVIRLTRVTAKEKCPYLLRLIEFYDEAHDRTFVFITNNVKLEAMTTPPFIKTVGKLNYSSRRLSKT